VGISSVDSGIDAGFSLTEQYNPASSGIQANAPDMSPSPTSPQGPQQVADVSSTLNSVKETVGNLVNRNSRPSSNNATATIGLRG